MQSSSLIIVAAAFSIVTEGSNESTYEPNYGYNGFEYTKGMLCEGNVAGYNQTTEVVSVASCMFTYMKGNLNVTFIPSFIGKHYVIRLRRANFIALVKHFPEAKPVQSQMYYDLLEHVPYFINIKCLCSGTQDFDPEPIVLSAYKTEKRDCRTWNVHVSLHPFPGLHTMNVRFAPTSGYELCFRNYSVELHPFEHGDCQQEIIVLNETKEAVYNNTEVVVSFKGVSPGNYCTTVTAKDQKCNDENCGNRYYASEKLEEPQEDKRRNLPKEKLDIIVVIVPLCILAVVFAVGIFGARRIKKHFTYWLPPVTSPCELEHPEDTEGNEEIVVSILNAPCVEQQQEVAYALCDFLRECCNVHPRIAYRACITLYLGLNMHLSIIYHTKMKKTKNS